MKESKDNGHSPNPNLIYNPILVWPSFKESRFIGSVMKIIIFDLDGVLAETGPPNVRTFQYGFRSMGYPVPDEDEIEELVGQKTIEMIVKLGCPPDAANDMFARYIEPYYLQIMPSSVRAYDGVSDTLRALRTKDCRLAVCTSGARNVQSLVLKRLGLLRFFDRIHTASDSNYSKPHPEFLREVVGSQVDNAYYVDDREEGLEMGKSIGVTTVYAQYGYGRLTRMEPDYNIKSIRDLLQVIK